jgi:hypothetical protein
MNRRSSLKSRNGKQRNARRSENISHPQQVDMVLKEHKTLRYISNAAFSGIITVGDLLDTLLFATTATAGFDVMQGMKINYIELWTIGTTNVPTTVNVQYFSNAASVNSASYVISDTSIGSTEPAHVKAKVPKASNAAFWQTGANTNDSMFILNIPANTIIDLDFNFIGFTEANSLPAQNALVGATAGLIYGRGLDGLASATTKLPMASGVYLPI